MRPAIGLLILITVMTSGCSGAPLDPHDDFYDLSVWEGSLVLSAPWFEGESNFTVLMVGTNAGATPLIGESGPKLWRFQLFHDIERDGAPVWEGWSTTVQDIGESVNLAPGHAHEFFSARIPKAEVASLSGGTYYVSAALAFREPLQRTPFVPAGSIEIAQP